jgi:transketolase
MDKNDWSKLASHLRYLILKMTHQVGSGHPTSCFSAVDLATVLFFKYLKYDVEHPQNPNNDRVIFSKGHASALYYALFATAGAVTDKELDTYRDFQSALEGHPTFRFPFTEAATGSLGQGLAIAAGEAYAVRKKIEDLNTGVENNNFEHLPHIYCLLGDGELAEGSVWEAAAWASHQKLSNLIAIVDVNRFGQSDETMYGHTIDIYRRRFAAFGWSSLEIDGHNFNEINCAYEKALIHQGGPVAIIAKTIKGKGIPLWEDKNGWHNKMLPVEELSKWLSIFQEQSDGIKGVISKPANDEALSFVAHPANPKSNSDAIVYDPAKLYPTKQAFGNAMIRLAEINPNLMVLDADVSNSLHTDKFKENFPEQFLELYIAEQNMVGVGIGLSKRGYLPVINTFACFLTRAHDQFRMLPLSDASLLVNGSYVGVTVGRDGPSQMGLDDLSMMRSIFGSTVLYPADPYQTEKLVNLATNLKGLVYVRTTREPTPVVYDQKAEFIIGGSKVFEPNSKLGSNTDTSKKKRIITIVAAGITLHEALKAQKLFANENIAIRVVDCYSVKPIDVKTLQLCAADSRAIVVVEDHYPEGGLGEAVMSALSDTSNISIHHLAVRKLPMSGKAEELLKFEGIDSDAIIQLIRQVLV